MARVILHIGTQKTGTTSLQRFLMDNPEYLARNGCFLLTSPEGRALFKQLDRGCFVVDRRRRFNRSPLKRFRLRMRSRINIRRKLADNPGLDAIVTCEGLCLLRDPREIDRLRRVFPRQTSFTVVMCCRDRETFLASFRSEYERQALASGKSTEVSSDPVAFNYFEPDSWLADYDAAIAAYKRLTDDVRVVDYDAVVARTGNIVPAMLQAFGIDEIPTDFDARLNVTPEAVQTPGGGNGPGMRVSGSPVPG